MYPTGYAGYMKTQIDLDDELLAAAQRELGTTTKKDTVNEALRLAATRGDRVREHLLSNNTYLLFGGADIDNPVVMREARR